MLLIFPYSLLKLFNFDLLEQMNINGQRLHSELGCYKHWTIKGDIQNISLCTWRALYCVFILNKLGKYI